MRTFLSRAALGGTAVSVAVVLAFGPLPAAADPVADFYKGRTISVVFGAGVGGSYGLYSQLAARHLGNKMPGTPSVVFQSMPGAGGMKALNYAYNAAPKDGSVIILAHQEVLQETILNENARFDVRNFQWIGRYVDADYIGLASEKSGAKSLDDARSRQYVAGATGARAASALAPLAFNLFADARFKIVAGYRGTDEMFLAQERGEVDIVTATWVVIRALHAPKLASGQLVPIFAMSLDRVPELSHVPVITEFGRDEAEKTFLRIWAAGGALGRSLAAPPGVPAERVEALRTAFLASVEDDAFKAEAEQRKAALNIMSGKDLESLIAKVMTLNPDQIASTRRVYAELLKSASEVTN